MIILLGVEVCRALTLYKEGYKKNGHPIVSLLDLLQLFYQRQLEGGAVSEMEIMDILGKREVELWTQFADILIGQRFIQKTEIGYYVLVRNLEKVDFGQFYLTLPWPLPQPQSLESINTHQGWGKELTPRFLAIHDYQQQQLSVSLAQILAAQDPKLDNNSL